MKRTTWPSQASRNRREPRPDADGSASPVARPQNMHERVEIWVNEGGAGGDDENRGAHAESAGRRGPSPEAPDDMRGVTPLPR